MRKKKWVGIFLIIFIIPMIITGCSRANTKSDEQKNSKKTIVVGMAQLGSESAWCAANTESIKKAGDEDEEIKLIFENAEGSQEKQIEILKSFIKQQVDVIVFAPCVEDGWDEILKEAKNVKILVILVDRTINVKDESLYECWIGSDFLLEGYYGGDWIKQYMNSIGRSRIKIWKRYYHNFIYHVFIFLIISSALTHIGHILS